MEQMTWHEAVSQLREQPESQELVRACFFDDPLVDAAERFHCSSEYVACKPFLPNTPGSALDVGAGRGILSYALAKDGWTVTAAEPDPSSLVGHGAIQDLFDQSNFDVRILDKGGETVDAENDTFNLVFCRQVLHHADDLQKFCNEMARVLKPGGTFIATREHVISKPEDKEAFFESHPLHKFYGGENAYELETYTDSIEQAGLIISHVLNPFDSAVNYFPATDKDIREAVAQAFRIPKFLGAMIPQKVISAVGKRNNTPGRLYSFVATKPPTEPIP